MTEEDLLLYGKENPLHALSPTSSTASSLPLIAVDSRPCSRRDPSAPSPHRGEASGPLPLISSPFGSQKRQGFSPTVHASGDAFPSLTISEKPTVPPHPSSVGCVGPMQDGEPSSSSTSSSQRKRQVKEAVEEKKADEEGEGEERHRPRAVIMKHRLPSSAQEKKRKRGHQTASSPPSHPLPTPSTTSSKEEARSEKESSHQSTPRRSAPDPPSKPTAPQVEKPKARKEEVAKEAPPRKSTRRTSPPPVVPPTTTTTATGGPPTSRRRRGRDGGEEDVHGPSYAASVPPPTTAAPFPSVPISASVPQGGIPKKKREHTSTSSEEEVERAMPGLPTTLDAHSYVSSSSYAVSGSSSSSSSSFHAPPGRSSKHPRLHATSSTRPDTPGTTVGGRGPSIASRKSKASKRLVERKPEKKDPISVVSMLSPYTGVKAPLSIGVHSSTVSHSSLSLHKSSCRASQKPPEEGEEDNNDEDDSDEREEEERRRWKRKRQQQKRKIEEQKKHREKERERQRAEKKEREIAEDREASRKHGGTWVRRFTHSGSSEEEEMDRGDSGDEMLPHRSYHPHHSSRSHSPHHPYHHRHYQGSQREGEGHARGTKKESGRGKSERREEDSASVATTTTTSKATPPRSGRPQKSHGGGKHSYSKSYVHEKSKEEMMAEFDKQTKANHRAFLRLCRGPTSGGVSANSSTNPTPCTSPGGGAVPLSMTAATFSSTHSEHYRIPGEDEDEDEDDDNDDEEKDATQQRQRHPAGGASEGASAWNGPSVVSSHGSSMLAIAVPHTTAPSGHTSPMGSPVVLGYPTPLASLASSHLLPHLRHTGKEEEEDSMVFGRGTVGLAARERERQRLAEMGISLATTSPASSSSSSPTTMMGPGSGRAGGGGVAFGSPSYTGGGGRSHAGLATKDFPTFASASQTNPPMSITSNPTEPSTQGKRRGDEPTSGGPPTQSHAGSPSATLSVFQRLQQSKNQVKTRPPVFCALAQQEFAHHQQACEMKQLEANATIYSRSRLKRHRRGRYAAANPTTLSTASTAAGGGTPLGGPPSTLEEPPPMMVFRQGLSDPSSSSSTAAQDGGERPFTVSEFMALQRLIRFGMPMNDALAAVRKAANPSALSATIRKQASEVEKQDKVEFTRTTDSMNSPTKKPLSSHGRFVGAVNATASRAPSSARDDARSPPPLKEKDNPAPPSSSSTTTTAPNTVFSPLYGRTRSIDLSLRPPTTSGTAIGSGHPSPSAPLAPMPASSSAAANKVYPDRKEVQCSPRRLPPPVFTTPGASHLGPPAYPTPLQPSTNAYHYGASSITTSQLPGSLLCMSSGPSSPMLLPPGGLMDAFGYFSMHRAQPQYYTKLEAAAGLPTTSTSLYGGDGGNVKLFPSATGAVFTTTSGSGKTNKRKAKRDGPYSPVRSPRRSKSKSREDASPLQGTTTSSSGKDRFSGEGGGGGGGERGMIKESSPHHRSGSGTSGRRKTEPRSSSYVASNASLSGERASDRPADSTRGRGSKLVPLGRGDGEEGT